MAVAGLLFAGCSSNSSEASSAASGAGETSNTAYVEADGTEISATVTKKDGKVTAIQIDQTTEDGSSKKEKGADYGMKSASPSVKNGTNRLNIWNSTWLITVLIPLN